MSNSRRANDGIHKTFDKWQQGDPSLKNLKAVADYFGCTVDDLIREENDQ